MEALKVGGVAKQAGVNLQTMHYYERRGLLPKPPRTALNYRAHPEDTVRRVRFIKRAQQLGFTLKEIKELLFLRAAPRTRCADVRRRAEDKVKDIEDKVRSLLVLCPGKTLHIFVCLWDRLLTSAALYFQRASEPRA